MVASVPPVKLAGGKDPVLCGSLVLEFERDVQLGAVGFDLALGIQLQVELDDLGDAQIAEGFSRPVDRGLRGLFPGIRAGTDKLDALSVMSSSRYGRRD
jgi:hypothetical protein